MIKYADGSQTEERNNLIVRETSDYTRNPRG